jgi:hypothetical protein
VAVLDAGKILFHGSTEEMQSLADGKVAQAVVDETEFSEWKERVQIIHHMAEGEGRIRVRFFPGLDPEIQGTPVKATLEDAYLYLLSGTQ